MIRGKNNFKIKFLANYFTFDLSTNLPFYVESGEKSQSFEQLMRNNILSLKQFFDEVIVFTNLSSK